MLTTKENPAVHTQKIMTYEIKYTATKEQITKEDSKTESQEQRLYKNKKRINNSGEV